MNLARLRLAGALLGLLASTLSVTAADRRLREAEALLERITVHFEALQADPERRIPPEILREAKGLFVVRETRAGLIFGGKGGAGVLLLKRPDGWGAPFIYRVREGGVGLQAGWQTATFAQLLMTDAAVAAVRTNRFRMGVGLRITSGPRSVGDEAKTRSPGSDVLVYTDAGGLFGGAALEGGTLTPDDRANAALYGPAAEPATGGEATALTPSVAGKALIALVERASRGEGGP